MNQTQGAGSSYHLGPEAKSVFFGVCAVLIAFVAVGCTPSGASISPTATTTHVQTSVPSSPTKLAPLPAGTVSLQPQQASTPAPSSTYVPDRNYLLYSRDEASFSPGGLQLHSLWALDDHGQKSGPIALGVGSDLRISPDCSQAIYFPELESSASSMRPHLVDLASSGHNSVGEIHGYVALTWSPDGQRVASDDGYEISVLDLESGHATVLTHCQDEDRGPMDCYSPAWSPNGSRIAYYGALAAPGEDPRDGVYLIDPECLGDECIPEGPLPLGEVFSWSPDGSTIASADLLTLHLFDVERGQVMQVVPVESNGEVPRISSIAWTPDASALTFTLDMGIGIVSLLTYQQATLATPDTSATGDPLAKHALTWVDGGCISKLAVLGH